MKKKMSDRKHMLLYYSRHSSICTDLLNNLDQHKGLVELLGLTILSVDSPQARQWLRKHRGDIIKNVPCLEVDYFNRDLQFITGVDDITAYLGL
ncbi:hypothetical protein ECIV_ORF78 [European chub iridovirus]|nr:hypothetical protein ECIV_ORF78 [European chub iridovirus]